MFHIKAYYVIGFLHQPGVHTLSKYFGFAAGFGLGTLAGIICCLYSFMRVRSFWTISGMSSARLLYSFGSSAKGTRRTYDSSLARAASGKLNLWKYITHENC